MPPAFRPDVWEGAAVFDGRMVDEAPLPDPDEGATLLVLTQRFRRLPDDGERVRYVQSSRPVLSGSKLDSTDPELLRAAWEHGEADGRDRVATFD